MLFRANRNRNLNSLRWRPAQQTRERRIPGEEGFLKARAAEGFPVSQSSKKIADKKCDVEEKDTFIANKRVGTGGVRWSSGCRYVWARRGAWIRSTWKGLPRPEEGAGGTCLQSMMVHPFGTLLWGSDHLWYFT